MTGDEDTLARGAIEHSLSQEGMGSVWDIEIEDAREGYARVAMSVRKVGRFMP